MPHLAQIYMTAESNLESFLQNNHFLPAVSKVKLPTGETLKPPVSTEKLLLGGPAAFGAGTSGICSSR